MRAAGLIPCPLFGQKARLLSWREGGVVLQGAPALDVCGAALAFARSRRTRLCPMTMKQVSRPDTAMATPLVRFELFPFRALRRSYSVAAGADEPRPAPFSCGCGTALLAWAKMAPSTLGDDSRHGDGCRTAQLARNGERYGAVVDFGKVDSATSSPSPTAGTARRHDHGRDPPDKASKQ